MRILTPLLLLSMLVGCTNPITIVDSTESDVIEYPEIGIAVTQGLGERLAAKGVRTTAPAIEIVQTTRFGLQEGESKLFGCAFTVRPILVSKRGVYSRDSVQGDCFGPVNYQVTKSDGTTNRWGCPGTYYVGDICRDTDGHFFLAYGAGRVELKQSFDHIELTESLVGRSPNSVRELVYNGRVGDNVKFIYREFSDDLVRPAFVQEVQYDLSESEIVGFKSLRMKILSASNTSITYELLENF